MRLTAVLIVCALLAGCGGGDKPATVASYRIDRGGTALTLDVIARPGSTARAHVVTQDSSGVMVQVRVTEPAGSNLDLGRHYPVTVRLAAPLGSRTVRTDDGVTVPSAAPS